MKGMPDYIIELDQALDEGMSKAIPVIVRQVDEERKNLMIGKAEDFLRTRTYSGANTDYLNGIRETIEILKAQYNSPMCDCRVCELEITYPEEFDQIITDVFDHIIDLEYKL